MRSRSLIIVALVLMLSLTFFSDLADPKDSTNSITQMNDSKTNVSLDPVNLEVGANENIIVYYFWAIGCVHCAATEPYIDSLIAKYPQITFLKLEISHNVTNNDLFLDLNNAFNTGRTTTPSAFIENEVALIGPDEIRADLESAILRLIGPPTAPQNLAANPGNGNVVLTWAVPANNGGAAITGYKVYRGTASGGQGTTPIATLGNVLTYTNTGLTNGGTYYYKVSAVNSKGEGPRSNEAWGAPVGPPTAPQNLAANPGNGNVVLTWSVPANNGGASIDYYIVYRDGIDIAHPTMSSRTITGLTNGQSYAFTVAAHNSAGTGPQSDPVPAIPLTVPGAPDGLTATPRNGQVSLSWSAPSSNGGAAIDYYVVYQNGTDIAHPTSTGQIVTGLMNGISYTFNVAAHNAAGMGSRSSGVSATPMAPTAIPTVPDPPTDLTAVPGNAQVTLSWSAPGSNGGATIDHYIVYQNGTDVQHPTGTSITITGLANGQAYGFSVAAHNSVGNGTPTSGVSATPSPAPAVPGAPTGLIATPGDSQVSLSWSAPGSDGGATIDHYLVYVDGVVRTDNYSTTSTTIAGLTNDQQYSFAIVAHNSVGAGAPSSAINATPTTVKNVPGVPTGLTATPGNTQITLSWTVPNNDGGVAIDTYIVYQDGMDISHPTTTSTTITGLTNGRSYNYTVAAHNSVGNGNQTSAVTATPTSGAMLPGVPTGLIITAGNGTATLSWTAPSGSSAIDYYIVYQNGVDADHTSATSTTITGLTNGENYTFAVAAHNSDGVGTRSSTQTVSPSATGSNNGATAPSGNDDMVYLYVVLALLAAIIIAATLLVRRNRKKA